MKEMQNLSSAPFYECANQKIMKNKLIGKTCDQLFSNSTRIGFAEQLIRGEGNFAHPHDKVPIDTNWLSEKLTSSNMLGSSSKLAWSSFSKICFVNILKSILLVKGLMKWTLVSLLRRSEAAFDLKRLCTMVACLFIVWDKISMNKVRVDCWVTCVKTMAVTLMNNLCDEHCPIFLLWLD